MDKPLEAVADFSALILRFPQDWEIRKFAAEAYRQSGDLQRAENEEKVAHELQIAEHVQLSWQAIESSNYAHALTRIDGALVQFPDAPSLYQVQAVARVQLQEYDAAIQSYTSALAIESNDATMLLERGKLYLEKRALTLALADFDRSIHLNPNISEAYYCRAIVHQELGNTEKSEADLKTSDELQILLVP